jgi:hypothetical protein
VVSLALSLPIGAYYAIKFSPLLLPIGALEVFFLFAYNLELFRGRFHTDLWFALSWGLLPVLAGYVSQTNQLAPVGLGAGLLGFATALAEIRTSRPYKEMTKLGTSAHVKAARLEGILKGLVASHVVLALLIVTLRAG